MQGFCFIDRRYSNGGLSIELPSEYRTSEYQTSERSLFMFPLFRCSLFRSPLYLTHSINPRPVSYSDPSVITNLENKVTGIHSLDPLGQILSINLEGLFETAKLEVVFHHLRFRFRFRLVLLACLGFLGRGFTVLTHVAGTILNLHKNCKTSRGMLRQKIQSFQDLKKFKT